MSLAQNLYDSGTITYHRTEGMDASTKIAVSQFWKHSVSTLLKTISNMTEFFKKMGSRMRL